MKATRLFTIGWRDAMRMVRYGWDAPRIAERIWIRPADCVAAVSSVLRQQTGQVLGGDWDLRVGPLSELPKFRMALMHWHCGLSWRDVGAYDYMMQRIAECGELDGCRSMTDVIARYDRLDVIFEHVQREGRLRTQAEVQPGNFREQRGVYVHIGRQNTPIFGSGGCHRLAIATVLELEQIPVQLGVVHPGALASWHVFRRPQSLRHTESKGEIRQRVPHDHRSSGR